MPDVAPGFALDEPIVQLAKIHARLDAIHEDVVALGEDVDKAIIGHLAAGGVTEHDLAVLYTRLQDATHSSGADDA